MHGLDTSNVSSRVESSQVEFEPMGPKSDFMNRTRIIGCWANKQLTLEVTQIMMTTMMNRIMKRMPRPRSATYSGGNARKSSKYVLSTSATGNSIMNILLLK